MSQSERRPRSDRVLAKTQVVVPQESTTMPRTEDLRGTVTLLSEPNPGATFAIGSGELVVGRSPEASLYIEDAGLSRAHARFFRQGNMYFVEDLNSTNGTLLNGETIREPEVLHDGVRIQAGKSTVLRFSLQDQLEQEAAQRLYDQSVRDVLTGLHNRRYLEDRLRSEFAYADRHRSDLAVLVIDVDYFKRVNDTHGHAAGDAVLKALGGALRAIVRLEDLAARYGGEEFVVLTRGADAERAMALGERIRSVVSEMVIRHEGTPIPVTVSVGVAALAARRYTSPHSMVAAADSALYQSKRAGRNCVTFA